MTPISVSIFTMADTDTAQTQQREKVTLDSNLESVSSS